MDGSLMGLNLTEALATAAAYGADPDQDLIEALSEIEMGALSGDRRQRQTPT
jgi:hypothetical protein